jgi:hypothetical protein
MVGKKPLILLIALLTLATPVSAVGVYDEGQLPKVVEAVIDSTQGDHPLTQCAIVSLNPLNLRPSCLNIYNLIANPGDYIEL